MSNNVHFTDFEQVFAHWELVIQELIRIYIHVEVIRQAS